MNRPAAIDRRTFVLAAGAAAIAAACGGGSEAGDTGAAEVSAGSSIVDDGTRLLQAGFADGMRAPSTLAAGTLARAPFVLFGPDGLPAVNDIPDTIDATLTLPSGEDVALTMDQRGEGLAVPHYPLVFDAPEAGVYGLRAVVADQAQQLEFRVAEADAVGLVQPGDPLRAVETPTFDDALGFDPICTRFEPCPFHETSLATVIDNGLPTALLVATPGFCQTTSCGPVVDLLMDLDPGESMNVVHAEVYTEPARLGEVQDFTSLLGPVVGTYEMDFEPSFVVANADGIVTARLDYSFDRSEMAEALDTV